MRGDFDPSPGTPLFVRRATLPHKGGGKESLDQREVPRMTALAALFLRDVRLALRVGGGAWMGVLFFLIVVALVPFAVGPDSALLQRIGAAILWLGALLASLLTLDQLFADDHEDGSLDLLLMGGMPLQLAIIAKALAHWLTAQLPLVIAAPLFGVFFNIDLPAMGAVALTLLAGTPALTFLGLIGAALAAMLRRGGLLVPVLILPLTIPVLIFGVAASSAALTGPVPFGTPFTVLCALSLASLVIGPVAAAAALRHAD
jgi:heme exporter protein B